MIIWWTFYNLPLMKCPWRLGWSGLW